MEDLHLYTLKSFSIAQTEIVLLLDNCYFTKPYSLPIELYFEKILYSHFVSIETNLSSIKHYCLEVKVVFLIIRPFPGKGVRSSGKGSTVSPQMCV